MIDLTESEQYYSYIHEESLETKKGDTVYYLYYPTIVLRCA